jgi:hypothetical protein
MTILLGLYVLAGCASHRYWTDRRGEAWHLLVPVVACVVGLVRLWRVLAVTYFRRRTDGPRRCYPIYERTRVRVWETGHWTEVQPATPEQIEAARERLFGQRRSPDDPAYGLSCVEELARSV